MDQNKLDNLNQAAKDFLEVQNEISPEEKKVLEEHFNPDTIQQLVDTINQEFQAQKEEKRKARNKRKAEKTKLKNKAVSRADRRKVHLVPRVV